METKGPPIFHVTLQRQEFQQNYGFQHSYSRSNGTFSITEVKEESVAMDAGLEPEQVIIEVNGETIEKRVAHVINDMMRENITEVQLLVANPWVAEYYKRANIPIDHNHARIVQLPVRRTDEVRVGPPLYQCVLRKSPEEHFGYSMRFDAVTMVHSFGTITEESIAAMAGLTPGQRIIAINNQNVQKCNSQEVQKVLSAEPNKMTFLVASKFAYAYYTKRRIKLDRNTSEVIVSLYE